MDGISPVSLSSDQMVPRYGKGMGPGKGMQPLIFQGKQKFFPGKSAYLKKKSMYLDKGFSLFPLISYAFALMLSKLQ